MINRFRGKRIYLDANIFIYALEDYPRYSALAGSVLDAIEAELIIAVTSELTLAEVLVHPLKQGREDVVIAYEELLDTGSSLQVAAVTRGLLRQSAEVRAKLGGRLPDAIHVATALATECSFFFTADRTLRVPTTINRVILDELLE